MVTLCSVWSRDDGYFIGSNRKNFTSIGCGLFILLNEYQLLNETKNQYLQRKKERLGVYVLLYGIKTRSIGVIWSFIKFL